MRAPDLCRSYREASSLLQGYVGTATVGAGLPAMRAPGLYRSHREARSLLQGYVGTASVGAGLPAMRARVCVGAIARQARSYRGMWGQLLWELACQRCGRPGLCRSHREASSLLQGYVGAASVGAGLPAMRAPGLCRSHREASSLLQGHVGAASVGAGLPAMRARICVGAIQGYGWQGRSMYGTLSAIYAV